MQKYSEIGGPWLPPAPPISTKCVLTMLNQVILNKYPSAVTQEDSARKLNMMPNYVISIWRERDLSIKVMLGTIGLVGTVHPEIVLLNMRHASFSSDIYSFGIVLFEIFTWRKAFDARRCEGVGI